MQTKLRNARVAVAGLGGLGSNIAVMLARSGVGELLLVDFDTVDVTNLNRQMYLIPQLGKPKAEALPEILYQINPYLTYRSVCIKVTPDNVKELFSEYPIVCEAFDKPDQKAMKAMIQVLIDEIDLPIIVDAGIGKPSQACEAMEMGAAAIMANTAIATAGNVPEMAAAFKLAIEAGRKAYLTGMGRVLARGGSASDPLTGFLH